MLPVQGPLLDFRREAILTHERHFCAEQPNALGTTIKGAIDITSQTDIDPKLKPPAVLGDTGQFL